MGFEYPNTKESAYDSLNGSWSTEDGKKSFRIDGNVISDIKGMGEEYDILPLNEEGLSLRWTGNKWIVENLRIFGSMTIEKWELNKITLANPMTTFGKEPQSMPVVIVRENPDV